MCVCYRAAPICIIMACQNRTRKRKKRKIRRAQYMNVLHIYFLSCFAGKATTPTICQKPCFYLSEMLLNFFDGNLPFPPSFLPPRIQIRLNPSSSSALEKRSLRGSRRDFLTFFFFPSVRTSQDTGEKGFGNFSIFRRGGMENFFSASFRKK